MDWVNFPGIFQEENGEWTATLGDWSERFKTEWMAVVVRDFRVLETLGDEAETNLDRTQVRDMMRRGGVPYITEQRAGAHRAEDLVRRARVQIEGPLPDPGPQRRGTPMQQNRDARQAEIEKTEKARASKRQAGEPAVMKRLSNFVGVYRTGKRWQAKVGTRYISSSDDERVAALMRDVGALDQALTDLNYPRSFVEEVLTSYSAKDLQKPSILSLFINRLDEEIARANAMRGGAPDRIGKGLAAAEAVQREEDDGGDPQ